MAITFDELMRIEREWVLLQLDLEITKEQIALNLGYKLV
jgi:hypothetical protein